MLFAYFCNYSINLKFLSNLSCSEKFYIFLIKNISIFFFQVLKLLQDQLIMTSFENLLIDYACYYNHCFFGLPF